MAIRRRRNLSLEFDPDSEPIVGRMRDEEGRSRAFAGWLGLAAVLGGFLRDANCADRAQPGPGPAERRGISTRVEPPTTPEGRTT